MPYKYFIIKRPLLTSIATVFLFFLYLPGACPREVHSIPRDAFVEAGISDARILIPFLADDTTSSSVCNMIYNGLVKTDKNLNIVGDLATSWAITDSGKCVTVKLRKGVKWHDEKPFTAEDVKFTFDALRDPRNGCPYISGYSNMSEIKVIDPYTVQFVYSRPYASQISKLGMGIIPEHLFRGIKDIRKSPYARAPVGTGPYRFKKWESGRFILLEADRNYFEHVPDIKHYVYDIVPDRTIQFLELVSGGIDSMQLSPYQYKFRSGTKEFTRSVKKYEYLGHSYVYIGYNIKDPLFADKKVRQAMSYGINVSSIINSVLYGFGEKCTGPFLKGTPYYDENVTGYGYDPDKARKLLREAGWVDSDSDGILDKDGKKFVFRLATNQGNQVRIDTAQIIQRQLSELGIKVEIQVVAWAAFLDQFIDKKNFQAVILGWSLPVDPDCYTVWDSAGGLNFISYSNSDVDRLIEEGRREFDPEKRAKIYRHIHRIISDDAPYTFLFFPDALPAVNKRIEGIKPAPAGISYNFIDWHVPEDKVKYKF